MLQMDDFEKNVRYWKSSLKNK